MKYRFSALSIMLLMAGEIFSQYSTDWIKPGDNYQKTGVMIARDKLDNVAVTGYWTAYNIFTRKYDKFGNLQWENMSASGVPSNYEKAFWVNSDSSNNIIVTGFRYTLGTYHFPNALVVLKYDPAGTLLWKNTITMTFFVNHLISMNLRTEVDNAGNIYIGTVATSPSGFVLTKIDPSGTILFTNNDNSSPVSQFLSMRLSGNHVVMSGSVPVTNNANAICWNTSGTVVWNTIKNGNGGMDIEMDESGNSYLLTSLDNQISPTSLSDIMIYKLDPSGSQLSVNSYDFGGSDFPTRFVYSGGRISTIGYGNIASGYFDWITFQTNTIGTKLWDARYNETSVNDEYPYGLTAKSNGEVFITGRGGPNHVIIGTPYLRMTTLKYDATGTRKWVDSVNVNNGWGRAITLATDNSLFAVSDGYTTAFHFLDHDGSAPAPIPVSLNVSSIGSTTATFTWSSVPGAYLYHLRYKKSTDPVWTIISTDNNSVAVSGLTENTSYDYACEAINSGGPSGYNATQQFVTGVVLPVSGLNFTAARSGLQVVLNWETVTEQNTDYFQIEKSNDGIHFLPIGQVIAAGNSASLLRYQFTDAVLSSNIRFYRLKLINLDATYHYSTVRVVATDDKKIRFHVFPNPARSHATLVLRELSREDLRLSIFNTAGQEVNSMLVPENTQTLQLDFSSLPKGSYYLRIKGQQFSESILILIQ